MSKSSQPLHQLSHQDHQWLSALVECASPFIDVSKTNASETSKRQRSKSIQFESLFVSTPLDPELDAQWLLGLAGFHWLAHWVDEKPSDQVIPVAIDNGSWLLTRSTVAANSTVSQWLDTFLTQWQMRQKVSDALVAHESFVQARSSWAVSQGVDVDAELVAIYSQGQWQLEWDSRCFSNAYILTLISLWQAAVSQLSVNSTKSVSGVDLGTFTDCLNPSKQNGPIGQYEKNLLARFSQRVNQHPSKVAAKYKLDSITFEEMTFEQLDRRSDQVAHVLATKGVGPKNYIGVAFERGLNMLVAQLAVLKLGAAFVPIDGQQPQQRLQHIVNDCPFALCLTDEVHQPKLIEKLPSHTHYLLASLVEESAEVATDPVPNAINIGTDDPAYVIFTSGSTGRPKGVTVSHGNLLNFVDFMDKYVGENSVSTQFAPFTFDASVAEIHCSLMNGGTLILLDKESIDDPEKLQALLTNQGVTFSAFPPSYLKHLHPDNLPHQQVLLTAGSAPDHGVVNTWQSKLTYINAYGPTETTILSTLWQADQPVPESQPIVMGTAIQNTAVAVVNRFGHVLPKGFLGELIIGGAGVALGYQNRPTLNQRAFFNWQGERWYHSGDLVCQNADDELIFYGRADNQIKLRGHRIELGEIEAAAHLLDSVENCAALVNEQGQLWLFCQGKNSDIQMALSDRLPTWAMPNRIFWLKSIPLTVNGKTDYKLLRQYQEQPEDPSPSKLSSLEAKVATIWENVLECSANSPEDNFVRLGGDSLSALSVVSALKKSGFQAHSSQVLGSTNLETFCSELKPIQGNMVAATATNTDLPEPLTQKFDGDIQQCFPLTDMQTAMVRQQQGYQVWMYYQFEMPLHANLLEATLNEVVAIHPALRTQVVGHDNQWLQAIRKNWRPSFSCTSMARGDAQHYFEHRITQQRQQEIDVFSQPSVWFEAAGDDSGFLLMLSVHHVNHDGFTISQVFADVLENYQRRLQSDHEVSRKKESNSESASTLEGLVRRQQELARDTKAIQYWRQKDWQTETCELALGQNHSQAKDVVISQIPLLEESIIVARSAAKKAGWTLNGLLMAAYGLTLRSLGRQDSVRFGVVLSGRDESVAGAQEVSGCCVNTLPMVLKIPTGKALLDVGQEAQFSLNELRRIMLFPASAVESIAKDQGADNLFQTLFNIESYGNEWAQPNLLGGFESTPFDLVFSVIEQAKGFHLRIASQFGTSETHSHQLASRLATQFQFWLDQLSQRLFASDEICEGDQPWNSFSIPMTGALTEIARPTSDYPKPPLWHLFEQQAQKHSDKIALWERPVEGYPIAYSYAQLQQRAQRLSARIALKLAQVNNPEPIVGILSDRSSDAVVAMLALMRLGCAYLPLDPKYPKDRLQHMLSDTQCPLILCQRPEWHDVLPEHSLPIMDLGDPELYHNGISVPEPYEFANDQHSSPEALAYVMYTSGSTGKPKGVMTEQQSIARLVLNTQYAPLTEDDHILLTGAPVFDATTYEIWGALLNGGTLSIVPETTLLDPRALAVTLRDRAITTLWLTSPLFNQHVQQQPAMFQPLRQLLVGGDALSVEHIRLAREANPHLTLVNGYGPTENTTFSVCHPMPPSDEPVAEAGHSIPIGQPIHNSTAYVVNDAGQPLPIGVCGELWVGGDGVARGYLNRPDLTAEKFIPDPFSSKPGARCYKTGDLVRWTEGGVIEFLGRLDDQVKIRGFRIELGEIETQLTRHEDVAEARVLVHEGDQGKQLVAYVAVGQADKGTLVFRQALTEHLQSRLPDYMVPSAWVVMDQLPLNQNGKVDRKRLPEPDWHWAEQADASQETTPLTSIEESLLDLVSQVAGFPCRQLHVDLFTLGLNSLDAVSLISEIRHQFQVDLSITDIFAKGDLKSLANQISHQIDNQSPTSTGDDLTEIDIDNLSEAELDQYLAQLAEQGA